jgi:hypothetical protein
MAIAIIGGLVLSTALSLLVVPAFYVVAEGRGGKKKKKAAGEIGETAESLIPKVESL